MGICTLGLWLWGQLGDLAEVVRLSLVCLSSNTEDLFWGSLSLEARGPGPSPSSQQEQMGFMFHSVCMKEASTWSSPLAVDRCWGPPGYDQDDGQRQARDQARIRVDPREHTDWRQKILRSQIRKPRSSQEMGDQKAKNLDVRGQEIENWESGCWGLETR